MNKAMRWMLIGLSGLLMASCGLEDDTREKVAKRSESAGVTTIAYINGCAECHAIGSSIEGPSWKHVAEHYKNRPDAKPYLIERIKHGGEPNWARITGGAEMHAYGNRVSDEHLNRLVDYILSAK
ncbi:MAG: c-type cytochrome [Gammaproteobacteria bacterium]|nr:c-type cytochrome [Gammaproteobacteria bacterium]